MSLCQMLLHTETAFDCLSALGCLGLVQFNNLAADARVGNLKFASEVERCSELKRILQSLQVKVGECGIEVVYCEDGELPQAKDLTEIELILQNLDKEMNDVERNYDRLRTQKNTLLEKWHILTKADEFLQSGRPASGAAASPWSDRLVMSLLHDETRHSERDHLLRLGFLSGSVPVERFHGFEVMLWRVTRGNFFMRHAEIRVPLEDVKSEEKNGLLKKNAFIVFFQGDAMREKIFKVCQGFAARLAQCPESHRERTFRRKMLAEEYEDLKIVLGQTEEHRRHLLEFAAANLCLWKQKTKKLLMIYYTLNKLKNSTHQLDNQKFLQAECWIPTADIPLVRSTLYRGAKHASRDDVELMFPPILTENIANDCVKVVPTYFRLNKFTRVFQELVDSYGVAAYRELNPAPYTIVTFPFLFSVMFGDAGHGLIMTIFGIWMVLKERKLSYRRAKASPNNTNEVWNLLFDGRYIIMLMGVFSIYTGLIYNDVFSKGFSFFGSQWRVDYEESAVAVDRRLQLDPSSPRFYLGEPYMFGMDPVWDASRENAIVTYNSVKMKLSIIFGVTHMFFGLILSALNHLHLRNYADLLLVCVPQIVFLLSLFAYLVFLIFFKWTMYGGHHAPPYDSACAPSILITFIDMVLMKSVAKTNVDQHECGKFMFPHQSSLQMSLMITAILCVPIMLAGKPILSMLRKRRTRRGPDDEELIELLCNKTNERKQLNNNMSELWIHQAVLCIESILGSVSHTASYLRLWALSLAHDQLSAVLWRMILALPLTMDMDWLSGLLLYGAFWIWSILTLAILVVMEGLSAFLHTLRLHWVEFQSKFYAGSGEKFTPFHFEKRD